MNSSVYSPSCLPASDSQYVGDSVWVVGWGRTLEGGAVADVLQVDINY